MNNPYSLPVISLTPDDFIALLTGDISNTNNFITLNHLFLQDSTMQNEIQPNSDRMPLIALICAVIMYQRFINNTRNTYLQNIDPKKYKKSFCPQNLNTERKLQPHIPIFVDAFNKTERELFFTCLKLSEEYKAIVCPFYIIRLEEASFSERVALWQQSIYSHVQSATYFTEGVKASPIRLYDPKNEEIIST